jgi:hypothetical protein
VIARALSVDGLLTELALIFVAADTDRFRRLLDWSLPTGMPDTFAMLVRLIRMMFRARWDILEPRYQEAKYRSVTPARCAEITRSILEDYDRLQQDALDSGVQGVDRFYGVFSRDLRPDVAACGDEWTKLMDAMRTPRRKAPRLWLANSSCCAPTMLSGWASRPGNSWTPSAIFINATRLRVPRALPSRRAPLPHSGSYSVSCGFGLNVSKAVMAGLAPAIHAVPPQISRLLRLPSVQRLMTRLPRSRGWRVEPGHDGKTEY